MLNPEIKKLWVAALRSDEYQQGKKALRKDGKFCCLGVLCNLHAQAHPEVAAQQKVPSFYMGWTDVPPPEVIAWAGLADRLGGTVRINGKTDALTAHNDRGRTFAQIADAIEAQL